jgi:hypothetical protein
MILTVTDQKGHTPHCQYAACAARWRVRRDDVLQTAVRIVDAVER